MPNMAQVAAITCCKMLEAEADKLCRAVSCLWCWQLTAIIGAVLIILACVGSTLAVRFTQPQVAMKK